MTDPNTEGAAALHALFAVILEGEEYVGLEDKAVAAWAAFDASDTVSIPRDKATLRMWLDGLPVEA